jgi:hypothetical protein
MEAEKLGATSPFGPSVLGTVTESHAKLLAQANPECMRCPAFWRLVGQASMYANSGDGNRRARVRESHEVAARIRQLVRSSYEPGHIPNSCAE